jgi:hypothetical protein
MKSSMERGETEKKEEAAFVKTSLFSSNKLSIN